MLFQTLPEAIWEATALFYQLEPFELIGFVCTEWLKCPPSVNTESSLPSGGIAAQLWQLTPSGSDGFPKMQRLVSSISSHPGSMDTMIPQFVTCLERLHSRRAQHLPPTLWLHHDTEVTT